MSLIFQVSAVMICDVTHQALITHTSSLPSPILAFRLTQAVYTYLITYFGEPARLDNIVWYVFFPGIRACLTASCYRSLVVSEGYLAHTDLIVTPRDRWKFCST